MKAWSITALVLVVVAMFIMAVTPVEAQGGTIDLGNLGDDQGEALAVNNLGQIVGYSSIVDSSSRHAFLWENGVMIDLGTLGGGSSCATSINDLGQVVGWSATEAGETTVFLWEDGTMLDLGIIPKGASISWYDRIQINNLGQIMVPSGDSGHALLWENGTLTDLGTLGGSQSRATGINNLGQVVGWSETESGSRHAFLWEDGSMVDLGSLLPEYSRINDINDLGQFVAHVGDEVLLWANGSITNLGYLAGLEPENGPAMPTAINNHGQIAGWTSPPDRAFLWINGKANYFGDGFCMGHDANDSGWIVGYCYRAVGPEPTLWKYALGCSADNSLLSVAEGDTAVHTGTVTDGAAVLSASVGTVEGNGDGTWSWSLETTGSPAENQTVTITAEDAYGGVGTCSFELAFYKREVTFEHVTRLGGYNDGSPIRIVARDGYAYLVSEQDSEGQVVDFTNPADPVQVGSWFTLAPQQVVIQGNYVYMQSSNSQWDPGLAAVDISDPYDPHQVGFCIAPWYFSQGLRVSGNHAYLTIDAEAVWDEESGTYTYIGGGLWIVDVSNPMNPTEIGFHDSSGKPNGVVVVGESAYLVDGVESLRVIDISQPNNPSEVASFELGAEVTGVAAAESYLYVPTKNRIVHVVDISDPTDPVEVNSFQTPGPTFSVSGGYAFSAFPCHVTSAEYDGVGFWMLDISDALNPRIIGAYDFDGCGAVEALDGDLLYVDRGVYLGAVDIVRFQIQTSSESVSVEVGAGGTATTDSEGDGATEADPIETSLTSPNAGQVSIRETDTTESALPGFALLSKQVEITAPTGTVDNPLTLVFLLDASLIPSGQDETSIQVFKDGVPVPACTGQPGTASPDPCVSRRTALMDGDAEITVLTSTASLWIFGVPTVGAISAPRDPVIVGTAITASAIYHVPDAAGTLSALWDWGDGTTSQMLLMELSGPISGDHSYTTPDVHTVALTLNDENGVVGSNTFQYIVVYDPNNGFVTGGGWIDSPEGACSDFCDGATGKASFGFVSKYKKGATVPTGNTEFNFSAGNLGFHSSSYDWLVVTGSDYAKFKGSGTINGEYDLNGNPYKFMLWAGDGEPDTFRIKIWWEEDDTEHIIYDNGMDQEIGGGSVQIHG